MSIIKRYTGSPAVFIALAILSLPLLYSFFHPGAAPGALRRRARSQAETSAGIKFSQLVKTRGAGMDKQMPMRDSLIKFYNFYKYRLLGKSGVPRVIIGKNGWLFQARKNREPNSPGYYPSLRPFSGSELREWQRLLGERRDWLRARGIAYLVIFVPDKNSVYPEYLPDNLRRFHRHSRLEQLSAFLQEGGADYLLAVRDDLLKAKGRLPVYDQTDSHWNDFGASVIYHRAFEFLDTLFQAPPGNAPISFQAEFGKVRAGGNLALMLSLERSLFLERRLKLYALTPSGARPARLPNLGLPRTVEPEAFENPEAPFGRAVMFHDSCGRRLKPFFARLFARIIYIRDWGFNFNARLVGAEIPGIVIDEIAEWYLYNRFPVNNFKERNGL